MSQNKSEGASSSRNRERADSFDNRSDSSVGSSARASSPKVAAATETLFSMAADDKWGFGPETDRVLAALETVRKKQLRLAAEHVALDTVLDINFVSAENEDETAQLFEQNTARFEERERALNKLMTGLVDLTDSTVELFDIADKSKVPQ